MQYLFSSRVYKKLKNKLQKSKLVVLFLDFDGTLVPIQKQFQACQVSDKIKNLLGRLSQEKKFKIIIISGRSVEFLKTRIDLKELYFSGNHGLEIEGVGFSFRIKQYRLWKLKMKKLAQALVNLGSSFSGVEIDNKGLSISLHYRNLNSDRITGFHKLIREFGANLAPEFKMFAGKKIYEFRPNTRDDKGGSVKRILNFFKAGRVFPIYIGDDTTDEDGFKAVNSGGCSIRVGSNRNSQAKYFVKSSQEVTRFLNKLIQLNHSKK